jgi:hypothetical protein
MQSEVPVFVLDATLVIGGILGLISAVFWPHNVPHISDCVMVSLGIWWIARYRIHLGRQKKSKPQGRAPRQDPPPTERYLAMVPRTPKPPGSFSAHAKPAKDDDAMSWNSR